MRSVLFCFLTACLFQIISIAPAITADWPRWRGPDLSGISAETEWEIPAETASDQKVIDGTATDGNGRSLVAWTSHVGTGFSSMVIQAGRAYTIGHRDDQDVVSCLDVNDGKVIWTMGYAAILDDRDFEGGPTSTPTLDGDRIYVLARSADLFCLSAEDGKQHWQKNIAAETNIRLPGWGCAAAPLVVGDRLLLNLGESGVAINKHNGEILWSSADRECGYASAVVIPNSDPPAAVFASGRAYIGVEIETGRQLWSERWLTSFNCNAAEAIFNGDQMFLSSGYNRGAALYGCKESEPQLIWKSKEMKNQIHTSLLFQDHLHGGHLYGLDGDMEAGARLVCMEWSSGTVVWSVDDLRPGGLTIAGGRLILLTESGEVIVAPASPVEFAPQSRLKFGEGKFWTSPVLSGGRLFCRSVDGQVFCLDCRK